MANYMRALGAIPRTQLQVWYPPRARRHKALVRETMQGLGLCCNGGCSLGDAAQAQGAVSMAATGAKAGGFIVPGIGNIVGAVVGLAIGAVLGKKKPVRASGAQVAQCQVLMQEYASAAAQSPALPLPVDLAALKDLNWCMMALYGPDIRLKDPRFFDGNFTDLTKIAQNMVRAIFTTPIGATVNIAETVNKIGKQTFRSSGLTFTNPPFTNLKAFARDTFQPVAIAYCQQAAGKGAGGCPTLYTRPEFSRWLFDLLGYIAATELPQVRAEDLNRPEPEAAPAPAPLPTPTGSPAPTPIAPPSQPLPAPTLQPQPMPIAMPEPKVQVIHVPSATAQPAPAPTVQAGAGSNVNPLLLGALGAGFLLMAMPTRSSGGTRRRRSAGK